MNKSDNWVIISLVISVLIYLFIWAIGLAKHKLVFYFSFLNGLTALSLIAYWVVREMGVTQHFIETREKAVLSLEVLVVAVSVYTILSASSNFWSKIAQYSIFGLHLICLVLFLIFMLTFKMDKLF